MTIQEAKQNIGKRFRLIAYTSADGILGRADYIRSVSDKGVIYGDFIEAPVEHCRLVGGQPEQLKKGKK